MDLGKLVSNMSGFLGGGVVSIVVGVIAMLLIAAAAVWLKKLNMDKARKDTENEKQDTSRREKERDAAEAPRDIQNRSDVDDFLGRNGP